MGFFKRKSKELNPCPRCHQLLEPDQLVCDMCGFDRREAQPGEATSRDEVGARK